MPAVGLIVSAVAPVTTLCLAAQAETGFEARVATTKFAVKPGSIGAGAVAARIVFAVATSRPRAHSRALSQKWLRWLTICAPSKAQHPLT